MGVIVKCKQQKKKKQYSGNLTAYQRQQRASFSKTRAMLTVQLSIIKENIVVFKKRNNVIYVKHGGLFVHPASRNTWYQAWRGTVMSIFTELKGSQALRDRVAPVHGVIIVWLGILWIICVCMWVWVCACVSFHMEGHWGEINHWCTSFEHLAASQPKEVPLYLKGKYTIINVESFQTFITAVIKCHSVKNVIFMTTWH